MADFRGPVAVARAPILQVVIFVTEDHLAGGHACVTATRDKVTMATMGKYRRWMQEMSLRDIEVVDIQVEDVFYQIQ